MLAVRVIPSLLMRGHQVVKGKQFNPWRSVGHIMQAVRINVARNCDELLLLDISATLESRGPDFAMIEKLSEWCRTPLTVGGGVRSVEDVTRLLRSGADKVSICTAALEDNLLIRKCADRFGSQAIVVAIDFSNNLVQSHGGTKSWALTPTEWAKLVASFGAGEILLTCVDREGGMSGYHLKTIANVAAAVDIPIIAHGGCSGPEDMLAAVRAGASAVAAGALFQFSDCTPLACAEYLAEHGVETRIPVPA